MCKLKSQATSWTEMITKTSEIPNESALSLQQVIDEFTPVFSSRSEVKCDECNTKINESSALQMPTQTVILHVDKVNAVYQQTTSGGRVDCRKDNIEIITDDEVKDMTKAERNKIIKKYLIYIIHHLDALYQYIIIRLKKARSLGKYHIRDFLSG